MALFSCPECKKKISTTCKTCPNCGMTLNDEIIKDSQEKDAKESKSAKIGCIIIILALTVLPIIILMFSSDDGESSEPVYNSTWDGSVKQVKNYIEKNAKDPDSIEYIEWSNVVKDVNGYKVHVKYRGKNSFGGYVIQNEIYYMDKKGNIINVNSYNF